MKVGIPKRSTPRASSRRHSRQPCTNRKLGLEVLIQAGAGDTSDLSDATYAEAGAKVVPDAAAVWGQGRILKVRQPTFIPGSSTRHEAIC